MIWRQLQSHWDYYRFVYAEESRFLWAFLLFLLGVIVLPEAWIGPVVISLAVISAIALVIDVWRIAAKWRSVRFIRRPHGPRMSERHPGAAAAVQWPATEPRLEDTSLHPGRTAVEIWFDAAVDRELQAQSPWARSGQDSGVAHAPAEVRLSQHRYDMPYALESGAAMALRVDRNTTERVRLPIRFNGRLLRLATEPTLAQLTDGDLTVEPVTYFDGESTNETWRLATADQPEVSPVQEFVLDRAGRIRALENARAANIIGISIVAVTADAQVVFVQQTQGNSIAPGALAASGSGSLEQVDLGGARPWWTPWRRHGIQPRGDLTGLVLTGMLRELREESLVKPEEIIADSAVVTGYFRWVDRAMKPEFAGLVRLSCTAADLTARAQRGAERAFTQRTVAVPLDALRMDTVGPGGSTGDYAAVSGAVSAGLREHLGGADLLRDGDRVLMSPSAEHAWYAAERFLRDRPDWLATTTP